MAEQLARHSDDFRYANLAIRGRLMHGVLEEQIEPAIALDPDLITIYAGGNDIMRPGFDPDGMIAAYEQALAKLTATGATVLVWTALDPEGLPVFDKLRGRLALYNELVREVADRQPITLFDFWTHREYRDNRLWDWDRLHMSPLGHEHMAALVLDRLGVSHTIAPLDLGPEPQLPEDRDRRENLQWAKDFLVPWVGRRVRGTSSGDGIAPKRPTLEPIAAE